MVRSRFEINLDVYLSLSGFEQCVIKENIYRESSAVGIYLKRRKRLDVSNFNFDDRMSKSSSNILKEFNYVSGLKVYSKKEKIFI